MSMDSEMARAAGELEMRAGLPCGSCGKPHATGAADWHGDGADWCCCACCIGHFHDHIGEIFREDFPDLIDRHGNVSDAAVDEAIRRLERKLTGAVKRP